MKIIKSISSQQIVDLVLHGQLKYGWGNIMDKYGYELSVNGMDEWLESLNQSQRNQLWVELQSVLN